MVAIPERVTLSPEQALESLKLWYDVSERLSILKKSEMDLRKTLAAHYVPTPREGVNRVDIGDGFDLVLDHKIHRKVDETLLDTSLKELRKAKVPVDELFPYKPSLSVSAYRELSAEQLLLVDAVLDIDVGAPSMDIGKAVQDNSKYKDDGGVQPGGFETPVATDTEEPEYAMTPLCDGVEYDTFIEAGWTDETLIEHGYMVLREPEGAALPPKPKRTRKKKA